MSYTCSRKMRIGRLVSTAVLIVQIAVLPAKALAQVDQNEIAQLRAQITALSDRLEQLETDNAEMNIAIEETQESSGSSSWYNKVRITGDLRSRYERLDDDGKDSARNRNRIRSRVGIIADVNEDFVMALGFAGGGDNPISTNQTLGGGGTTKDIRLDYAYFEYHGFDNMMITGGKYRNVFFKPGGSGQNMIFDGDYRPEGLGLQYENSNTFFNAGTFFIESDDKAGTQDEEMMWGVQLGHETALENGALTFGASYFDAALKGSQPFYNNLSYRNTLDANGAYMYDFEVVELFVEGNFTLGNQPLRLYADLVQNQDADKYDTGWVLGGKIGDVGGPGEWEFGYAYQDLEADAVFAALTDSDFSDGGADGKGHILNAAYGIGNRTEIGLTYWLNEYGEASQGQEIDYDRLHMYMTVAF